MDDRIRFVERTSGPERLVCECEVEINDGLLAGMKLTGFSLWRSAEGDVFVSLPSRPFGAGESRRYFDLLRAQSATGARATVKALKAAILEAWAIQGSCADEAAV